MNLNAPCDMPRADVAVDDDDNDDHANSDAGMYAKIA